MLGGEKGVLILEDGVEEFDGEVSGVSFFFEGRHVVGERDGPVAGEGAVGIVLLALGDVGVGVVDVDVGDAVEGERFDVFDGGAAVPGVKKVEDEGGVIVFGAVEHGLGVGDVFDGGVVADKLEGGGAIFFAADLEEVGKAGVEL